MNQPKIIFLLILCCAQAGSAFATECIDQFTSCRKISDGRVLCKDFYTGETRELPSTLVRKFQNSDYQECVPSRSGEPNRWSGERQQIQNSTKSSSGDFPSWQIILSAIFVAFLGFRYLSKTLACPKCGTRKAKKYAERRVVLESKMRMGTQTIDTPTHHNGHTHHHYHVLPTIYYDEQVAYEMKCNKCETIWSRTVKEKN